MYLSEHITYMNTLSDL